MKFSVSPGKSRSVASRPRMSKQRAVSARFKSAKEPREGNVDGQFYVDHTCINCDTCRWMAPSTFSRVGDGSSVTAQPQTKEERIEAIRATLSCPTFSIHMRHNDKAELKEAQNGMPIPVPGCPGVYHCGYHSEKSFGGTSYLIVRPEGNILMDSPRFNQLLAKKFEELGGVKYVVLSHTDDMADHKKWAQHFKATRIMHIDEIRRARTIDDIEVQLTGGGPWDLQGDVISGDALDGGVQIIHVPGHTSGSIAMWHAPTKIMFTGDHIGYSERVGRISLFERYNRGGIKNQVESAKKLLNYDFLHVLPGHGRRFSVKDATERLEMMNELVAYYS